MWAAAMVELLAVSRAATKAEQKAENLAAVKVESSAAHLVGCSADETVVQKVPHLAVRKAGWLAASLADESAAH